MTTAKQIIIKNFDFWTSSTKSKTNKQSSDNQNLDLYGIKKLREMILELAIRGLLLPQDKSDEPAQKLLNRLQNEKMQLIKKGKIKHPKDLSPLEDPLPFQIPDNWVWTQLGVISEIAPKNNIPDNLKVGFVPMPLVSKSYEGKHEQEIRNWSEVKKGYTHFADGDIAIAKITPCFENSKAAIFSNLKNGYGAGTTELHVARLIGNFISSRFILLYLKAPMFLEKGKLNMTGTAGQQRIPVRFFSNNPLPLPPLAEQYRIVKKVDKLMKLCDELEIVHKSTLETHKNLVDKLLNDLTSAPANSLQLREAWLKIQSNFDNLFTTERSIDQFKKTIHQLAVMGKLVPQALEGEHSEELIKRIKKTLPSKKNANPFLKNIGKTILDESNYDLPSGWAWIPLGNIGIWATGCGFPKEYQGNVGKEILFCKVSDMNLEGNEIKILKTVNTIDSKVLEKIRGKINIPGTVIFPKIGGAIATHKRRLICKPTLIDNNCSGIQPIGLTDSRWLLMFMHSLDLTKYQSGTSVPAVSQSSLDPIRIGLPPLEEQRRIVRKVDHLISLCDQIKLTLSNSATTQMELADSLLETAIR